MTLYSGLMLFLALSSAYKGREKIKFVFSSVVLMCLMGFKDLTVGNDTPNYIEFFSRLQKLPSLIDKSSRFEKGYQIYAKFIGYFFNSYQALFIITAIICISCICYGIYRNSINWQYSLFLFVGLRFYYFFLSGLRQSIAVSIIFVAYVYLKEKKNIKFIALTLLASTFHFSALIFLFALPVSKMKIEKQGIIKIVISIVCVYILFGPLLNIILSHMPAYYSHYLTTDATSANNMADFINAIIPCLILLLAAFTGYRSNSENNKSGDSYNFLYCDLDTQLLFLIIASGLSFIATRASILDRMVQYYWLFSIITISNILFTIKDNRKRTIWYFIITSFIIVYNLAILFFRPQWNAIIPYKFFWK